ncbi:hypothetical protein ACLD0W_13105 [Alloalcanivorax sp. C16-1]|uniref:hypothetical protein n=1 Tax=Alloalcanivorax sp. C16-1 TaxID=3390051 RepID=UPI0039706EB1
MSLNERQFIAKDDALKSLEEFGLPDSRNDSLDITSWHARVARIVLEEKVPIDVRQTFENAKNISLYSYYSYRLHQSAEIIGYKALEQALKAKYDAVKGALSQNPPKTLANYVEIALEQSWVTDEKMFSMRPIAAERVRERHVRKMILNGEIEAEPVASPKPTEEQILQELRSMQVARKALHGARRMRNYHMHEDTGLSDTSAEVLQDLAELINQIFSGN